MLSSIHPLGERTRNNRWSFTVVAFAVGAAAAGSAVGAVLGGGGALLLSAFSDPARLVLTASIAVVAGVLDLTGAKVPGPKRQVNEHWIGTFRGWVYGGAFGVELGAGVATYVVTWAVYAVFAAEFLTANPAAGALVGGVFGLGRSLALFLAGRVDRASRLTSFHARMDRLGPWARNVASYGALAVGVFALGGVLL